MKKVLFILVLMMSVVVVNAQTTKTATKHPKSAHSTLKATDLPKTVTDNIAKDYPGFTVKEAKSMTGKNGLSYEVSVTKGTETETLLYDKDGKFLKNESPKMAMHHEKKK